MENREYRRKRGTARKFKTTPAEAAVEFERLYPEVVARARERRLHPKPQTSWATNFSLEDGD